MRNARTGIALALGFLIVALPVPGQVVTAPPPSAAPNTNLEAQLADLKAKTAQLLADYRVRASQPKYADLLARSRALLPEERQRALDYFKAAFDLWKWGDFTTAEFLFKQGLDLDPANYVGNFYYADILKRQNNLAGAAEYYSRTAELGGAHPETFQAQAALQSPPKVDPRPVIRRVRGAIKEFSDCTDGCPRMVVIPAGKYAMGSSASDNTAENNERPRHGVSIGYSFAVGKYDVTFAEWDACVAGGGCNGYKPRDRGWGRGRMPVIDVSWGDAQAYVTWLSQKTGHSYRLPSESEWEYFARAGTTTLFSVGNSISSAQANYDGTFTVDRKRVNGPFRKKTVPVGSFRPNAFGLYGIHGNVWQWTADCYNKSYDGAPSDGSVWQSGNCTQRVLRGGAWNMGALEVRSAFRNDSDATVRLVINGFRVARDL